MPIGRSLPFDFAPLPLLPVVGQGSEVQPTGCGSDAELIGVGMACTTGRTFVCFRQPCVSYDEEASMEFLFKGTVEARRLSPFKPARRS
jgi:hypothetical protein